MAKEVGFVEEMEKDDVWLKAHLEEIVDRYARQVIAILDQKVVGSRGLHSGASADCYRTIPEAGPADF